MVTAWIATSAVVIVLLVLEQSASCEHCYTAVRRQLSQLACAYDLPPCSYPGAIWL